MINTTTARKTRFSRTGALGQKDEFTLLLTSLLIGAVTGLVAILFNKLIGWVSQLGFGWAGNWLPHDLLIVIIPTLGGLIAGPLITRYAREAKGHGVPEVMEAIALKGGKMKPRVALIKALASSITIGTGGSVGREGPIVQIGAVFGSTTGQVFRLPKESTATLVASGAAAGIAAVFNAPIAGVIFAVEVILGDISIRNIIPVVIAAVAANTVMDAIIGGETAFYVPTPYAFTSVWELVIYAILGVLAALLAVLFVKTLYGTEDLFAAQKLIPEALQPALGGLLLGLMALLYRAVFPSLNFTGLPQVFGSGYESINQSLNGGIALASALLLIILKLLATNLTLGSGGSGGIFAPALFMGAMLGTAVGLVAHQLFPGVTAPSGAYALVGMAAVFAGSAHAPITAALMLFELTGDYALMLPLMLTVAIATLLSRILLKGDSIYSLKLSRRGIRLNKGRDIDVLQGITVGEIMTDKYETVPASMTLSEFSKFLSLSPQNGFPVLDGSGDFAGIISMYDLNKATKNDLPRETPVIEFCSPIEKTIRTTTDETMDEALIKMARHHLGRLPVVSEDNPREILGLIQREEIIRAYEEAILRRAVLQNRAECLKMRKIDGMEFLEYEINPGDAIVSKSLMEIAPMIPHNSVLVSVRREGRMLIPHGDTIFLAGDRITAYTSADAKAQLIQNL